jgi:hypothetical protein
MNDPNFLFKPGGLAKTLSETNHAIVMNSASMWMPYFSRIRSVTVIDGNHHVLERNSATIRVSGQCHRCQATIDRMRQRVSKADWRFRAVEIISRGHSALAISALMPTPRCTMT